MQRNIQIFSKMHSGFEIKTFPFDVQHHNVIGLDFHPKGRNWPVVYLIHNERELYVGETNSALSRMNQHLDNSERRHLKQVRIIFDKEYNKSAILDIEQSLLHLYSVDGKYVLQNRNGGQSQKHNYYQREKYLNKIDDIWATLHGLGMTSKSILDIRNSDSYKYSPYNSLTEEQNQVCITTLNSILDNLLNDERGVTIIQGTAGTGKSVVLMNMIFQLANSQSFNVAFSEEDDDLTDFQGIQHKVQQYLGEHNKSELKIAYIIAMKSFRATIKHVFSITKHGLKSQMVIGPSDIKKADVDDKYDVLFVDESHRLARRKNISYMGAFDDKCRELFGEECNVTECTQMDWILAASKNVVMVYDNGQRVAGSDITDEQFWETIDNSRFNVTVKLLRTQMRCQGGTEFASYIQHILDCDCSKMQSTENYDFKLFDDIAELVNEIHRKESECKLCRVVAGYSWEWKSKGLKTAEEVVRQNREDIEIDDHKYIWNMTSSAWILSENAVNEIGCIHTTQGYDLNYVGVIFGREIDYDPDSNEIVIYKDFFFDKKAKNGSTVNQLKEYIINAYRTIMLRGVRGCYVYACNPNMRSYLHRFIQSEKVTASVPKFSFVVQLNENIISSQRYTTHLPVYPLRAACGYFDECGSLPEEEAEGWIDASGIGRKLNENMFVVHAEGKSMEPKIYDGDLCIFEKTAGSHQGKIVLAKAKDELDPEAGSYTIKKYSSEKSADEDGVWHHTRVVLSPLNMEFQPIVIDAEGTEEGDFKIYAELVQVIEKQ